MIPILLDTTKSLTELVADTTNGLGRLTDCTSCKVTETRNGAYDLTLDYPITGTHFDLITNNGLVKVIPADGKTAQIFRIYKISKPMSGIVTIDAHHISYDLAKVAVLPFNAIGVVDACNQLDSSTVGATYPFRMFTNITNSTSVFSQSVPGSYRSYLGGISGSFLDRFGGELEWDNLTVNLVANRGQDNGVQIRYGKNLSSLKQDENIDAVYTACLGYATVEESTIIGNLITVVESTQPKVKIIDLTQSFDQDETITTESVTAKTQAYVTANPINVPDVSLDVSFVALWQTEEYKNIAPLERVNLCDTVYVYFPKLNVSAKSKVVQTEYDVLNERYTKITLGSTKSSLSQTISSQTNNKIVQATSNLESAIDLATKMLSGGLGGSIIINRDANGKPYELLAIDTDDLASATKVMRFNKNGWGISVTGYNGAYITAATAYGINANTITTGTLNANLIASNSISADQLLIGVKNDILQGVSANKIASDLSVYFRFDSSGAHVGRAGSDFTNTFDEHSLKISYQDISQLTIDETGVDGINGTFHKYLTVGDHATQLTARMEHYEDDIDNDQIATFLIPRG